MPRELVVVGDLHGDLTALERILERTKPDGFFENPDNKIVFLGDYVDRGKNSIGVLATLLELQSNHPDSVVLMRGNHEAPNLFPFDSHTLQREMYTQMSQGDEIYRKVLSLFDLLPVLTLVKDRIILVHGGLPIHVPSSGKDVRETIIQAARVDPRFMEELLWNDPKDKIANQGAWEKSRRSYGFHYGESITVDWLKLLRARVVVRGHEPCRGFNILHHERVLTLFSCRESYPNFEAAFVRVSEQGIRSLSNATDLIPYIQKL